MRGVQDVVGEVQEKDEEILTGREEIMQEERDKLQGRLVVMEIDEAELKRRDERMAKEWKIE